MHESGGDSREELSGFRVGFLFRLDFRFVDEVVPAEAGVSFVEAGGLLRPLAATTAKHGRAGVLTVGVTSLLDYPPRAESRSVVVVLQQQVAPAEQQPSAAWSVEGGSGALDPGCSPS